MESLVISYKLGFPRILCGYYLYVITEISEVAEIGNIS